MTVYVLDKSKLPVTVIDTYQSLIWTKRYYDCGDFELYMPANTDLLEYLQPDYFLTRDDDESVMVIEKIQIRTDAENGDTFIISGRSLESILTRRIFNKQFLLTSIGSIESAIWACVQECTGAHSGGREPYRAIPSLSVDMSGESIWVGTIRAQFTGDTLLDGIISICKQKSIGFRMIFQGSYMLLQMYKGTEVPVVFSPEFDNVVNSTYVFDNTNFANTVYCAGEGEGSARRWVSVIKGTFANRPTGLDLHEFFADARDVSSNNGAINAYDYSEMLSERASAILSEHAAAEGLEAEVEPDATYQYKNDYNLGDIVKVANGYGAETSKRIIEIIECWDDTGYSVIPTFEEVQDEKPSMPILRDSTGAILRDSTGAILLVRE